MEDDGMSLCVGGTINIDGVRTSITEEEVDEEENRKWDLELKNAVQNAFDDLDDDSQDHSALYSDDHSQESENEVSTSKGDRSSYSLHSKGNYEPVTTTTNEHYTTNSDQSPPAWSEHSDLSGNFVTEHSLMKSPTQFQLNMNNVLSHSDDSSAIGNYHPNMAKDQHHLPDSLLLTKNKNHKDDFYFHISQNDYLSAETSEEHLKLLYEARGREIDRLSEELNELKLTSSQEISSLKSHLAVLKAEKETVLAGSTQMKLLLSENEGRIRSYSTDLKERDKKIKNLEAKCKQLKLELNTAEGTISSLETQVAELQSLDCLAKSRQANEEFLRKLQGSHREEMEELKRRLGTMTERAKDFEHQVKLLESKLETIRMSKENDWQGKDENIRQLNFQLEEAQQHIKILLSTQTEDTSSKKCECCARLQNEMKTYDTLLKLGFFKSVLNHEDTADQLTLGKALTFDESSSDPKSNPDVNKNHGSDSSIYEKMKKELFESLLMSKSYRDQIQQMTENITEKQKTIRILESQVKSLKETSKQNRNSCGKDNSVLLMEENTNLKKELTTLISHYEEVKATGATNIESLLAKLSSNAIMTKNAKPENVKEYAETVRICDKIFSHTLEELRKDNLELHSKRYLMVNGLKTLVTSIEDLKNDINLKSIPRSSNSKALEELLHAFSLNAKDIKEEVNQCFKENTKLKNEIWTQKLNLEKLKTENARLKTLANTLQEAAAEIEKEKLHAIENCKEIYLKFHEEAVSKLREDLQNEYNGIITTSKEEIERVYSKLKDAQNNYLEVCHEKDKIEELYRDLISENEHNKLDGAKENFVKENENLKRALHDLKSKVVVLEKKLVETEKSKNDKSSSAVGSDSDCYRDAKEQISHLTTQVQNLEAQIKVLVQEHKEEKDLLLQEIEMIRTERNKALETKGADFSISDMIETIDKYKKFNNSLKDEKDKLKMYYEKQVQDLLKQIELHRNDVISQSKKSCEDEFKDQINSLKDDITRLSASLRSLEEEKANLLDKHNKEVKILCEQIFEKETKINQVKESFEINSNNLIANNHDLNVRIHKLQNETKELKEREDLSIKKYSNLKKKFFKLKKNFEKYRSWSDERVDELVLEANRRLKQKSEYCENEFEGFKKWLANIRSILADSVLQVIDHLKSISKGYGTLSLEPQIYALAAVHNTILKLDIRNKNIEHLQGTNKNPVS